MSLSVLIPTVGGREQMLYQTWAAFQQTVDGCEVTAIEGFSWGEGCNRLAATACGQYWLFACDDALPAPGWFGAAREMVDAGLTPASRYFGLDGLPLRPGSDDAPHMAAVPWVRNFLLTPAIYAQIGPMIDTTWWADIDYSERMTSAGRPIHACDGFSFTHLDGPRDWLTKEEEARQRRVYEASRAR